MHIPIFFPQPTTTPPPQDSSSADSTYIRRFHAALPNTTTITTNKPTPLTPLPQLAQHLGLKAVFLKDESQRFGLPSFKILGASWGCFRAVCVALDVDYRTTSAGQLQTLIRESNKKQKIGVYTATEGNHGRAVAYMARLLGVEAHVFVPGYMHAHTKACIQEDGAEIHIVRGDYDLAVGHAAAAASASTMTNETRILVQDTAWQGYEQIPGWIVDGYSTLMAEIDEQLQQYSVKSPSIIVTPVGVGSLASAVARHCKSHDQTTKVVAVEPETGACLYKSLAAGESVTVTTAPSIMNGSCCGTLSSLAWDVLRHTVDASVAVSDYASHQAVRYLQTQGISAGPCGGSTLAALRCLAETKQDTIALDKDAVVILLSTEGARPYPEPVDASLTSTQH
ncbi:hypothetical protein PISL3812_05437 [Talaromyces islandicus]|uniref:Tryptophan synthase beta chain-like PALP domain-containing protein n=1 Tax=Talaromyces islandicus TaxID=28573 RepID=A0A0U1LYJ7_TALIS|nr:hypothetical protein PISL3812_05437 [Talaromyces islandicus]